MSNEMSEELAIEAIAVLDRLIQRALKIAGKAPYWVCDGDEAKFAKLDISDDGVAVLRWPDVETGWDYSTLETGEVSFPARLLFISDVELAAWQLEELREHEREEARRTREWEQKQEAKARAVFERLKALYG